MKNSERLQSAYLVLGTVLALVFSAWRGLSMGEPLPIDVPLLLLFLAVGLTVRSASFRLNDWVDISLDTTICVSALFILGTHWAATVLVVTTGGHLAWTQVLRRSEVPRLRSLLVVVFVTAASLASLLLAAWALEVEALVAAIGTLHLARDAGTSLGLDLAEALAWKVGLVSAVFLVAQYALVLPRHLFAGRALKTLLLRVLVPGLSIELAILPLAYLVVFAYHRSLLPSLSGANAAFLLILVAYAGVVIGVRFLARYGDQVRSRLQEMERLNRFHSKISASLQLNLLCEMVTDTLLETFADVDGAAIVLQRESLVRVRGRTDELQVRVEREVRDRLKRQDDSRPGSIVFLPLAPEARGGGLIGFYRDPASRRAFSKADVRVFRLLVNIVDVAVQNARLYEIATIDGLTGLYVRRYFEQRLTEEFIRSGRYGENFTLVLIDLNYFKQINDVYGHIVGDRILKSVGEILRDSVRSMDVPARYGGDEFAILLPRASREDADLIRERIEEGIERCVVEVGHEHVGVAASIGMASYLTDRPADPTEMILKADDRLYEAKKNRRKPRIGNGADAPPDPVN
jgi:diguanylate cyclase (GGDEF)-like protein